MKPIPSKIRREIAKDNFYKLCCVTGSPDVSIEHTFLFGKSQINELWALVPLRRDLNISHPPRIVKDTCRFIALLRAKKMGLWEDIKQRFYKKDWDQEFRRLENIFYNEIEKLKAIM